MNNLIFAVLIMALLYYFCYYLPQQQQLASNPPFTHSQFTQTDPIQKDNQALEELKTKHQALLSKNKDYQSQITSLQSEVRDLAKRPVKPTNSKSVQTSDEELTKTLDHLIKEIQHLNNSL